jgi:hypothetical protein
MQKDLVPFQFAAESPLPYAMMVAHLALPTVDPSGAPATFSYKLVTEVLKNKLGYKGLIITDDIEMQAAKSAGGIGERAVKAILAGNDMVMVGWNYKNQRTAIKATLQAVKKGHITQVRLNESLRKILQLKNRLVDKSFEPPLPPQQLKKSLKAHLNQLRLLTNKLTLKNMELSLRGYSYLKGSFKPEEDLFVFSSDYRFARAVDRSSPKGAKYIPLRRKQKKSPIPGALGNKPNSQAIYYVTGRGTARKLNRLNPKWKKKIVVVNTTHPGLIPQTADYKAVVNINSRNYLSGGWIAEYLFPRTEKKQLPDIQEEIRKPASKKATPKGRPFSVNTLFPGEFPFTLPSQDELERVEPFSGTSEPDLW